MDERVVELWKDYRDAVQEVYGKSQHGFGFDEDAVTEPDLEGLVGRSNELTDALAERLPGNGEEPDHAQPPDPELEAAALAVAVIDTAVAADALHALREEVRELAGDALVPPLVELAVPSRLEMESVQELLSEADDVFPEGTVLRGAAPGPDSAQELAEGAIDQLLSGATPLATSCGVGLLTLGATDLIGAVGGSAAIDAIAKGVGLRVGQALRLIASGVAKISSVIGSERLIDAAIHVSLHPGIDALIVGARIDERIVARAVRVEDSKEQVGIRLQSHAPNTSTLDGRLEDLCRDYAKNMKWGKRYARTLKFAAPAVVILGFGPPGSAAVAGANGVGLTYALFSLADRLDTVPQWLSRLSGVPTIVTEC